MTSLKTLKMEVWIMQVYQTCISLMAKSEESLSKRLADAITETMWQDHILENIPSTAKDDMHAWIFKTCDIDLWNGENFMKHDINDLHEMICKLDDDQAYSAIEHLCGATSKITDAVTSGGYKVPKNAQ
ncbi:MAG: hypothetical protein ACRDBL_14525 [Rhabdaerophilum sp.]